MEKRNWVIYIIGGGLVATPMIVKEVLYFDIQAPVLFIILKTISMVIGCTLCIVTFLRSCEFLKDSTNQNKGVKK